MIEFRERERGRERVTMEDTVVLKTKTAASTPANQNLNQVAAAKISSQIREEGELSPSEDDAFPAGSSSPLITSIAAPAEPVRVASNKNAQLVKAGNSISPNNPTSFVDVPSRTSLQPYQRKNPEKNRVPFVISFSDDDSSSESEEPIQAKALETKHNTKGIDESKRPTFSSLAKSQASRQNTTNNTKVMPRKVPLSRTFVSSMTKINGASSRNGGPLSVDQRSRVTNSNTLNKTKAGRELGHSQNIHLNSSKLQDLRQLIAIRENELKLKATQQSKETVPGSVKDYNVENLSNDRARISRETSTEFLPFEPKEPEKKRQKVNEVDEPHTTPPDSDGRQDMAGVEAVEKAVLECFDQQCVEQEENRGCVSSANLHNSMNKDTGLVTDSAQCNSVTKMVGPSVSNRTPRTFPQKSQTLELKRHQIPRSLPNSSFTNKSPRRSHSKKSRALQVRSADKAVNPVPHHQTLSLRTPDVNPEPSHVSMNNASLRNSPRNVFGTSNMDLQSLLEFEELQDKELEEAQEIRRKCEIEERNTLKAHRKAQRASFEADARCAQIYRQRELISAQIRSLYLKDSSLLWSSRSQNQMPELNMHLLPSSRHQMQCEFDVENQHGYDSDVRFVDQQKDTQNLALNASSESDASTSDPLKGTGVDNVICSPSNESNTSEDEDEHEDLLSSDHKSGASNQNDDRRKDLIEGSKNFASSDDSLLLEASLRSQLFTRLGIKHSLEKRDPIQSIDPVVERRIQNCDEGDEAETSMENITFSEAGKDQHLDLEDIRAVGSASFLSPTLRSAFGHVKISDAISKVQSQSRDTQIHTPDIYDEESNSLVPSESEPINLITNSTNEALMDICVGNGGSYNSNLAIDPFWPLCMYELRGKCNNDECCWQHVRDYSRRNINHENSDNGDCDGAKNLFKSTDDLVTSPPTYIVCLDVLQTDNHPYESVVARSIGKCWRKRFSISLVLSCLLSTDLPSDEPFLHGTEACVEVPGGWNRQFSHFHSREGPLGLLEQHSTDNDHSLEMALLNLNQEVNKHKGRIEALKVLARALEADPSCVVIWIVYLHIYYSNQKSIGKDDMFHCAVEHNKGSYELWLMYINSRVHLDDCLAAYNTALSALCAHSSASGTDATRASESILDLFLQMMNCLCVSGKVGAAIQTIYGLYPSSKKSDDPHSPFLPDIITHLTIYDKCIFWVCCVYLSVYKKLPDDIVHCFECRKELFAIEWPSTNISVDEKQQSIKLMELAVDSLALYIDTETTLKAAQFFALNHIRGIAVLQGLECSRNLLEKYVKLYPSCLELVVMSTHAVHDFGDSGFLGFEEALCKLPGAQRIWNQYAESALRSGKLDFAKELMDRWFQCSQSETLDIFGLLNLSLHKILQDDPSEAILAIDHALEAASPEDYKQCAMEHAAFFGSQVKADSSTSKIFNLLNRYLVDTRAFSGSEPLSRKFIQSIKKSRVRQLVSNLLTPLSSDFSLMNSILKVWYGPSLLPSNVKLVNLVDFVEAIMENRPVNYPIAISLCKVLTGAAGSCDVYSSVSFWAHSLLVNALFQAVPVAPEYVWVEAAGVLQNLTCGQSVSESFHRRALSVYPFSLQLWKSYLNFSSKVNRNVNSVVEAAKERGIKVD